MKGPNGPNQMNEMIGLMNRTASSGWIHFSIQERVGRRKNL